jgi:integrase
MRGTGRTFKRGGVWWISYYHRGTEYRESSGSVKEADAKRLLKKRLGEIHGKKFIGPQEERVTFEDLTGLLIQDYSVRGLRSAETTEFRMKRLRAFFGMDRAIDITPTRLRAYQAARLEDGAQPGTINRELAALHRAFRLAVKAGLLTTCPSFPERLEENTPRQGFFEHSEYLEIRKHLIPDYQDVLDFAYFSGWRRKEITDLQ